MPTGNQLFLKGLDMDVSSATSLAFRELLVGAQQIRRIRREAHDSLDSEHSKSYPWTASTATRNSFRLDPWRVPLTFPRIG